MTQTILPYRSPTDVNQSQRRKGVSILVWAVSGVVVCGMLIAVMLPSLCRSSETANRVKCASNLRQLGQAIAMYANDNGGHYPPSLAALGSIEDLTGDAMICPSSNDERSRAKSSAQLVADLTGAETNAPGHHHCLSYRYVGQALTQSTATDTTIVAYEPLTNHDNDGVNVLFGDGHAEFMTKKGWLQMAREAKIEIEMPKAH